MKRPLLHIIVLSLIPFAATSLHAQGRASGVPAPVLKATVDKQRILIGEPIHLMLEATVNGNTPFTWPTLDSLPHFDFIEKRPVDSTISPGQRYYRQYLTVTSFDSGMWAIPRLPFVNGRRTFLTDSIPIRIIYTKIDPSKDYHDIKDIVDVPNPFARWLGWIVAVVALVSAAFVILLLRKKKILKVLVGRQPPPPRLSPYEEAMAQLDELVKLRLAEDGKVKVLYSRMGEILRVYLYRRTGIASLSETSEELIGQIRRLSLAQQRFSDLADALRMSDFVKFAKYQPGRADTDFHYQVIRGSIEELNQHLDAEDRVQAAVAQQTK